MERTHHEELLHIPQYAIPWWFVCRVRTKALQGTFRYRTRSMSAKYFVVSKPGGFFWTLLFVQPELVMRNF